ncbi:hypothetical protein F8388_026684 [Cannabis sativa]|uniref:Disease resistance protein n=1 Tax=Cannabis sativa TaxID=3483 RepID=A0A7J6H1J1_CANSA|nr:hypothetical protein F8388_026684 [Cannabis sativa]
MMNTLIKSPSKVDKSKYRIVDKSPCKVGVVISDHKVWKNFKSVTSSLSPSGRGVESRLRKIIEWLELIAKYKNVLGLKDNNGERSFGLKQRLETTCLVEESCVYGRSEDKEMILKDKTQDDHGNRIFEKARHSSYFRGKRDALTRFEALNGADCLRTFLPLDPIESIGLPTTLPSLTMLEIDGCQSLEELPKLPSIHDVELKQCQAAVLESIVALKSLSHLRMCQILDLTSLPDGLFQNLTALEELHITHLNHLTALPNKIGLHKLPSLQRMEISGCPLLEELPQSLHKLPSLKELRVWKCPLLESFPSTGLPSTLTGLEITECNALHSLPNWKIHDKKLSLSLEYLTVEGCPLLTHLPRDDLPNTLKEVEIHDCRNLESLPKDLIHGDSLEFLSIVGCHSITDLPASHHPRVTSNMIRNLKQLIIKDCANLKLLPDGLQNLIHLVHIEITNCPLLLSFPESGLPLMMLKSLRLCNCQSLNSLPNHMHNSLNSLEELSMEGCSSISSFPQGGLPVNLISLSILDCEKLKPTFEWGLHRLTRLTNLVFGGCNELVSFPDEWLLPSTLSSLQLQRLPNLKMLPKGIENLSCLDELEIWECHNLQTLLDDQQPNMLQNFNFWDVL